MHETFYFRTEPSTRTRQPLKPPALTPHEQILEIRQELFPDTHDNVKAIELYATLGDRITQYHRNNFDQTNGLALHDVNCAHFAETMADEGASDCIESVKALDALRGELIDEPYTLPMGHVGIVATTEDLADPEGWHHFLHAGIGTDREDEWFCVTGFRGDLAIASISEDIKYQREIILPNGPETYQCISPDSVQLYDYGLRPSIAPLLEPPDIDPPST